MSDSTQDDLGAAIVEFDLAVDFYKLALEAPHVADIFQIGSKDHHREGAGLLVSAEINEMDALTPGFYAQDFARDALDFADMVRSFLDGDAVGVGEQWEGCKQ